MLVESGGSDGAHAYWKIAKPLAAARAVKATGELVEPIERANLRLASDAPRRHCQRQDPRKRSSR